MERTDGLERRTSLARNDSWHNCGSGAGHPGAYFDKYGHFLGAPPPAEIAHNKVNEANASESFMIYIWFRARRRQRTSATDHETRDDA